MNAVRFDFSGARVLVTALNGIGLGIATAFTDAGARVTITGTAATTGDYATIFRRSPIVSSTRATARRSCVSRRRWTASTSS